MGDEDERDCFKLIGSVGILGEIEGMGDAAVKKYFDIAVEDEEMRGGAIDRERKDCL